MDSRTMRSCLYVSMTIWCGLLSVEAPLARQAPSQPSSTARLRTFADLAHEKKSVSVDPNNKNHATILVGPDAWPFAVPLVRRNGTWSFDTAAGIQELTYRRVGGNELNAIEICRGFVEAQEEYALQKHDGSDVNQYAQRIISTPGNRTVSLGGRRTANGKDRLARTSRPRSTRATPPDSPIMATTSRY